MRLNLGCGQVPLKGCVNIDALPAPGVDRVMDIRDLDYPPNSVERVYMIHVIEHFTLDDAIRILTKVRDILVPQGQVWLEGPDIVKCVKNYPEAEAVLSIFGHPLKLSQGVETYQHKWGWTANTLQSTLMAIGFSARDQGGGNSHGRPNRDFFIVGWKK